MNLSPLRTETGFEDYKPPYTAIQAVSEASRCLYCHDAPCVRACPTHIDIPQFIRKIATGNLKGSARTIFEANILGYSCARACPVEELCVGDCVYNAAGVPPIQIGRLQRYSTEIAVREGWQFFEAGAPTGKSVGLVGAGPASLACAHELRRLGHSCTVYEKSQLAGGLDVSGIAPYKLKSEEALAEIAWMMGIGGIELQTGVEAGVSFSWESLEERHDAVFVGMGLGPDRRLPGSDREGVHGAVAWIERMKLGQVQTGIKEAVVVGGGNTAMDCLRELALLKVPSVTMVYRGSESAMSGYAHEWEAAKKLGVRAIFGATPLSFEGDPLSSLRIRTAEDEQQLPAQLVLLAIGQAKLGAALAPLGIEVEEGGRLKVGAGGALSRPRWYAGGDCANGGKEVVNAVAEGKAAARSIHRLFQNGVS